MANQSTFRTMKKHVRHTARVSRHSFRIAIFLGGAACVAVCSLGFAWLAEEMLGLNRKITHAYWWSALLMLPLGFAGIRWMTTVSYTHLTLPTICSV